MNKELLKFTDNQLLNELQARRYIRNIWQEDDIVIKAREMNIELTEDQLHNIAQQLERIDGDIGINWDTIEDTIFNTVNEFKHFTK